jgi:xylulokinase
MLLYDVRRGAWSETMAAAAQVPLGKLPTIRDPWDLAGALSADAARHLSLRCGTPVYVGGGDDIEFLGYGIVEPGAALEHIGTTGSIMACIDRPVADPAMAVELYPHVEPSMWLVGGSVNAAGGALDWASQVLDLPVGADLRVCSPPALDRPLIFLPYLAGERCPIWEPAAKGCWFGLTLVHQRADLLRAAHEGVCFALRHVLQTIEDLPPVPDESRTENPAVSIPYLVTPKSDADAGWLAMRATIYGRPLRVVDTPDPTALGTAIVAGLGAGLYASLAAGVAATRGNDEWLEPDMSQAPRYNQLFALYRELTTTVHPLFSRFSGGLSDNEDPDH